MTLSSFFIMLIMKCFGMDAHHGVVQTGETRTSNQKHRISFTTFVWGSNSFLKLTLNIFANATDLKNKSQVWQSTEICLGDKTKSRKVRFYLPLSLSKCTGTFLFEDSIFVNHDLDINLCYVGSLNSMHLTN